MDILWVKAGKLLPADTGGRMRSYNILRHLAAVHRVTFFSYYGGHRDEAYEVEVARRLPGAVTFHTAAPDTTLLKRGIDYLRRLPSPAPYAVTKFTDTRVRGIVGTWIGARRFAVAVCDFLSASLNFPAALCTPTLLFQHNVESTLWSRQAAWEPNPVKKFVFRLESAKMARYERKAIKRFHHVVAVSEQDRRQMETMVDPSRITVIPTGVDLQRYRSVALSQANEPLVVFIGSMDWEANIDAVEYFCHCIWPRLRAAVPEARFRIVGRNPHRRVQKLACDSVQVTGTVSSVADHLAAAAVIVVPLRIGGGTRLKIYEAMAAGKAIVSTSIGAEGLDVHHGSDILLADDAASFARDVSMLLRDRELRQRYGRAAAGLVAHYDWSVIARRFSQVLEQIAAPLNPRERCERRIMARQT